ncbi:MAG: TonB family protein [Aquificaceae bacterium]
MYQSPASANERLTAALLSLALSLALVFPVIFVDFSLPPREETKTVPIELLPEPLPPPPPKEEPVKEKEPPKRPQPRQERPAFKAPQRLTEAISPKPSEKPIEQEREIPPSPPEAQKGISQQADIPVRPSAETSKELSAQPSLPPAPPPPPPAQKPPEDLIARYLAKLQAAIDARKQYPEPARRHGITGRVVLTVRIESDGRISSVSVSGSSASKILDSEAQRLVRSIGKFDPPPGGQPITVSVAITYSLED